MVGGYIWPLSCDDVRTNSIDVQMSSHQMSYATKDTYIYKWHSGKFISKLLHFYLHESYSDHNTCIYVYMIIRKCV